jgi:hypothetical protein
VFFLIFILWNMVNYIYHQNSTLAHKNDNKNFSLLHPTSWLYSEIRVVSVFTFVPFKPRSGSWIPGMHIIWEGSITSLSEDLRNGPKSCDCFTLWIYKWSHVKIYKRACNTTLITESQKAALVCDTYPCQFCNPIKMVLHGHAYNYFNTLWASMKNDSCNF